jgi:hypothetical protein
MMTRSFSLLFFWALIQQTNGDVCDSHNWSVLLNRTNANEDHCTDDIVMVIVAQMQACVSHGSNGQLNLPGARRDGISRRLLANPEPRKLRTTPLRQRTAPLQQQERKLNECQNCQNLGYLLYDYGSGLCADTCGVGGTCDCDRRLESGDDSQDERNLSWDTDMEPGSQGWYETRMTRRCKWVLKAFAENLSQDADNDCMGDPDSLEVSAYCVD